MKLIAAKGGLRRATLLRHKREADQRHSAGEAVRDVHEVVQIYHPRARERDEYRHERDQVGVNVACEPPAASKCSAKRTAPVHHARRSPAKRRQQGQQKQPKPNGDRGISTTQPAATPPVRRFRLTGDRLDGKLRRFGRSSAMRARPVSARQAVTASATANDARIPYGVLHDVVIREVRAHKTPHLPAGRRSEPCATRGRDPCKLAPDAAAVDLKRACQTRDLTRLAGERSARLEKRNRKMDHRGFTCRARRELPHERRRGKILASLTR